MEFMLSQSNRQFTITADGVTHTENLTNVGNGSRNVFARVGSNFRGKIWNLNIGDVASYSMIVRSRTAPAFEGNNEFTDSMGGEALTLLNPDPTNPFILLGVDPQR